MGNKIEPREEDLVKVFVPTTAPGAYGFDLIEIRKSALDKGKVVESFEPDVFAICINNMTKAFRDAFGI